MRRKPGVLLPIEVSILDAGLDLERRGARGFHGYLLASEIADHDGARRMLAHGSLYRALGRMERAGLLDSAWEDAELAAAQDRPRRRLYRVTLAGARAIAVAHDALTDTDSQSRRRTGEAPA
jgi:DNA-binding PadR family transcriptional regulator